ncbi:AI-2E family transporter [Saccharopolyspora sp. 5N708]|uniref:AI-2E family transporter n=1 Tax=Saccharopolyspora sp. 5N708 TaxID=3457424 RepID=UPI003FCF6162
MYLLVGALAALAYTAREMLLLIFLGFFIALGVEPLVAWLHRHRWRRGLAVAAIILAVLLIVGGLALLAVVPAVRQLNEFAVQVPQLLSRLGAQFGTGTPVQGQLADPSVHDQVKTAATTLARVAGSALAAGFAAAGAFFGSVLAACTVGALMVYFSLAMPRIQAAAHRAAGRADRAKAIRTAMGRVGGYVTGQALVCTCAGVASYLFFLIAGVPYPALLALVVALLDAVPQVGATLASLAGILVALSQSITLGVITLIFFIIYQQVENYLIAPRVFAKAVELSPLGAFLAILLGTALAGVLGAVIALPIAAALKVLLRQAQAERREHPHAEGTGTASPT